jgi:hypothetical protein
VKALLNEAEEVEHDAGGVPAAEAPVSALRGERDELEHWLALPTTVFALEQLGRVREARRVGILAFASACGYVLIAGLTFAQERTDLQKESKQSSEALEHANEQLEAARRAEQEAFETHRIAFDAFTALEASKTISAQALDSAERNRLLAAADAAESNRKQSLHATLAERLDNSQKEFDARANEVAAAELAARIFRERREPPDADPTLLEEQLVKAREALKRAQAKVAKDRAELEKYPPEASSVTADTSPVKSADADYATRIREAAEARGEEARAQGDYQLALRQLEEQQRRHSESKEADGDVKRRADSPARLKLPLLDLELGPEWFFSLSPVSLLVVYGYVVFLGRGSSKSWSALEARAHRAGITSQQVRSALFPMGHGTASALVVDLMLVVTLILLWLTQPSASGLGLLVVLLAAVAGTRWAAARPRARALETTLSAQTVFMISE